MPTHFLLNFLIGLFLIRFRQWWEMMQTAERPPGSELKDRLRKLSCVFPPSFPDEKVLQSYMTPNVDESSEQFSWGVPDMDLLKYALG